MNKRIPILIIEDDAELKELLEYNLRLEGFEVYWAKQGAAGLKLARKTRPEVILLDWMMPGMDGLEVLSELKYSRKTNDIPVFMMTAKNKIGDIDRAFEIGADDYITKPFKLMQLGKIIREKLAKLEKTKCR